MYRGSTCIRQAVFQDIRKTYKAWKTIWITIKHPGVMVAFLNLMSEGAGSIPAGANTFFQFIILPPHIRGNLAMRSLDSFVKYCSAVRLEIMTNRSKNSNTDSKNSTDE